MKDNMKKAYLVDYIKNKRVSLVLDYATVQYINQTQLMMVTTGYHDSKTGEFYDYRFILIN
jgi:hypothetical protein